MLQVVGRGFDVHGVGKCLCKLLGVRHCALLYFANGSVLQKVNRSSSHPIVTF